MAGDAIRVNGNQYDWGSIAIKVGGQVYHGFTAANHSQKRERAKGYGTGKHRAPRGRTRGKYSAEGSLVATKSTAEQLRADLAAQSADGKSYGDVVFQVVIQYIEAGEIPITEELVDCVLAGEDVGHDEGSTDPLNETLPLDVMYIRKNGRTLFDNADGVF